MSAKTPIIIDTDPGIDDAMAIFYALSEPSIELVGLTSVFGNVPVETATRNALQLLELAGVSAPVAAGAGRPLERPPAPHPDFVHGAEGFGREMLPPPSHAAVADPAHAFLARAAASRPGEITIVAIGPLTNVARALEADPSIVGNVKRLVVMGGAVGVPGNVTPRAEANIWQDPDAAARVFAADWPITLVGLDVTETVRCPRGALAPMRAASPNCGAFLVPAVDFYMDFHLSSRNLDACYLHDPVAVVASHDPGLFQTEATALSVAVDGDAIGETAPTASGPRIDVCRVADVDAVRAAFLKTIGSGVLP